MVRDALDREPDALITITTPVSQIAANATLDYGRPATCDLQCRVQPLCRRHRRRTPCIKPAHISGSQFLAPYDRIVPLMLLQEPDMQVSGHDLHLQRTQWHLWRELKSRAVGESLGLQVESASIISAADLTLAAEGLVSKGIEAFVLPTEATVAVWLASHHTGRERTWPARDVYRGERRLPRRDDRRGRL